MRILLVTDWNRGRGGAEAYATWLRQGLREAGDDACLLTSSAGTAADGTADFVAFGTHRWPPRHFSRSPTRSPPHRCAMLSAGSVPRSLV